MVKLQMILCVKIVSIGALIICKMDIWESFIRGEHKMIRIMQIGYGYWGNNVAKKLILSSKFELEYLVETDLKKCEMARTTMPNVPVINDYLEKLDEVDAVAICTQT